MSSDFSIESIGSACEITTGFPFKSSGYCDKSESVKLLRGDNIAQGCLRWDGVKRWNTDELERSVEARYSLRSGDVVIAMDRPWIEAGLKFAAIQDSDLPCLLVQRVARLRAGEKVDQGFLKYVVSDYAFTSHVLAVQTGTAVPHISSKQIAEYMFAAPPLGEQRAIAHILGTLDDKIELNRKTNETLEAMAKALFKSWFVDFDPVRAKAEGRPTGLPADISDLFPDSFEDSELGEIPSGWEVKALDEIAHFLNGLALQKFPPEDGAATLPVIKIAQLKKGESTGADRCSTAVPSDYVVRDGDVLFSWSGSLAVDIWCGGDGALNQHLFKVTSKTYGKWFFYQWVNHHLPDFQEIAQGKATTMGHIQRHHLSEAKVLIPPPSLLAAMDSAFTALLDRAFGLRSQSKDLGSIRDALLPKLISGEIRIPDAEKMLEEVGI
jgi:type I restriction enzyme S subunit